MKLALVAASLVLVAAGAVGCSDDGGGGSGGDDKTSTTDFCGALKGFQDDVSNSADPSKDLAASVKALKDAADKLDSVGTPDDMPADAKAGFELTIKTIGELPDDATPDDLGQMGDFSDADQKKIDALNDYISKACPDLNGEPPASTDSTPSAVTPSSS